MHVSGRQAVIKISTVIPASFTLVPPGCSLAHIDHFPGLFIYFQDCCALWELQFLQSPLTLPRDLLQLERDGRGTRKETPPIVCGYLKGCVSRTEPTRGPGDGQLLLLSR